MYAASSDSSQNGAAVPTFGTFEPPIASELARYFDEVCHHDSVGSSAKLRNATETLVRRLKADGLPPERVVIAIKDSLTRFGGSNRPPSLADLDNVLGERESAVYRSVFGWCLDTYYETA